MGKRGPKPKHSDTDYANAIVAFTAEHGYPPTFRELANALGVWPGGYHSRRIKQLRESGALRPGIARLVIDAHPQGD